MYEVRTLHLIREDGTYFDLDMTYATRMAIRSDLEEEFRENSQKPPSKMVIHSDFDEENRGKQQKPQPKEEDRLKVLKG